MRQVEGFDVGCGGAHHCELFPAVDGRYGIVHIGIAACLHLYDGQTYIPPPWRARRWLSGFSGSAGTLVVPAEGHARLWTDSRYFLQAAEQLEGTETELMKEGLPGTPSIEAWLAEELPAGAAVGVDAMLMSVGALRGLRTALKARGIRLDTMFDALPAIWTDRPALPKCAVFVHDEQYAGLSAASKIAGALDGARAHGAIR